MSDNIKVVVKVRPLISREIEEKLSYQWCVKNNSLKQLDQNGRENGSSFTFDKVYDKDTKTLEVYNDVAKPIVEAAIAGFNGTIFAYGQTSSGKTFTMSGTDGSPGIIPLAVLNLFDIIKTVTDRDFLVRVSYIEIYNETLRDLLDVNKKNIQIKNTLQGIKVDATERVTCSPEEVLDAMKEGEANRQTGATNMNEESSRSHSIFQITIESREHVEVEEQVGVVNVSQLNLVDLAGSERSGQTGATGIRFKEGTHINKSLSVLALVIKQLSEDPKKFANYRDSKLTRILQNSLGGNAKTSIICAITPASVDETISTLQFANRAKAIKNTPEVNAVATDATMVQNLTKQLSKLQSQLESKKNVEKTNVNLQRQIEALQKWVSIGFGNDMGTRKEQPLRRKTISTLHPAEEDPVPAVPRFCTPSLKYNPMSLSLDIFPIPKSHKTSLATLPEEPRMITPPPRDKIVHFDGEIIELDSDDDKMDVQTCSPYHPCRGSSKTPPCVLRKNAKQAEKSLHDIVELTEREKIYAPDVVELIKKLEQNSTVIAKLESEINILRDHTKEKDLEIEKLLSKVSATEDQLDTLTNAKADLEILCNSYNTKLTDWEVTYETLKKKAKSREEDLVSLLEENKILRRTEEISKLSRTLDKEVTNFMNMSKDISLVNSDTENSIANANDEESTAQIQELAIELQSQLTKKSQAVSELENDILTQKQKINSLENVSQELQSMVAKLKEKMTEMEAENTYLKTTVETLNTTINNQKASLESANDDLKSYNSVIEDLQVKLNKKDELLNVKITESTLEAMIANEERFIANNDNIKNIIHSFKITLDSRNNEIERLKTTIQNDTHLSVDNIALKEQIVSKEKQINALIEEMEMLKIQQNENVDVINKLMCKVEEQNTIFKNNIDEKLSQIESLKSDILELSITVSEKNTKEQDLTSTNDNLKKKVEDLTNRIINLETDISSKDNVISSLKNCNNDTENNMSKATSSITKLCNILTILKCTIDDIPDVIDNIELFFDILDRNLNNLERQTDNISAEIKQSVELKEQLSYVLEFNQSEKDNLQKQIESLNKSRTELLNQNEELSNQILELTRELNNVRQQQEEKHQANIVLKSKLKESIGNLRNELLFKDDIVTTLQEKISTLSVEINSISQSKEQHHSNLIQKLDDLNTNQESLKQMLREKDTEISQLQSIIQGHNVQVSTLTQKLNENRDNTDLLLSNIFNKLCKVAADFYIENSISCEIEDINNTYESILLTIDKITNYMVVSKFERVKNSMNDALSEAKEQITDLMQQNLELMEAFAEIDFKNQELQSEIEELNKINLELSGTSQLIEQLKTELKAKATELDMMENKAKELKDKFTEFECLMKEQMKQLQAENESLKERVVETEAETTKHDDVDNKIRKSISNLVENVERKSPQSLLTICCNKIIEAMEPEENDYKSATSSSSKEDIACRNTDTDKDNICMYSNIKSQLHNALEENMKLKDELRCLESFNRHLIDEQEEVRKEIKLLIEPANELHKKIANHRTNLHTLTATTYTENKLLNTKLKVLKHHHARYIHVCQRDIPAFKSQLHDLMAILKGNSCLTDKQNDSFKRYSLPNVLDSNATVCNFKNDSTLDGDMLMLDTNVTLTTSADNTLLGNYQSYLDATQINFDTDVACQTDDLGNILDPCLDYSRMEVLTNDNRQMNEKLKVFQEENAILREQINNYYSTRDNHKVDAHSSPIKKNGSSPYNSLSNTLIEDLSVCKDKHEDAKEQKLLEEIRMLSQELTNVKARKEEIEERYADLVLEIPSTDALVKKLTNLEKEYVNKTEEITKLTNNLRDKNKMIKDLQEENDTLSSQVMENISEADDLRKELDVLKEVTNELKQLDRLEKVSESTIHTDESDCSQSKAKDQIIKTLLNTQSLEVNSKLNRSLSHDNNSSRLNKIYTLLNELHASKEDCKKISEAVATIKNHLDHSNPSIELDHSIGDSNLFTFTKDYDGNEEEVCNFNNLKNPEEHPSDTYMMDKMDCLTYFIEKTDAANDNLSSDIKIIDIMKMLYDILVTKHGNEVENLANKLRDYEECNGQLQTEIQNVNSKYSKIIKDLELKDNNIKTIANTLSKIRSVINVINEEMPSLTDANNTKLVATFKENVLKTLDTEFDLSTIHIFESLIANIVSKHEKDLNEITKKYTELQQRMENVMSELKSANDNLTQTKSQLLDKENEYSLLKAQKERVYDISNAVTKDIVELNETISKGCDKLLELNIICPGDMDATESLSGYVNIIFERLISLSKEQNKSNLEQEKESLITELNYSKKTLIEKEELLETLKEKLIDTENKLQTQLALQNDMNQLYEIKAKENKPNVEMIEKLTQEINVLQKTVFEKETIIQTLESAINSKDKEIALEKETTVAELTQKIRDFAQENEQLKSINEIIMKEKETYSIELENVGESLKKNKSDLDRMTADVLVLRETIADNVSVIESLTLEAKNLLHHNEQLKKRFEEKCQNCSRLEKNIKTHEKTAEIQNKMIMRLQKQKEQDDQAIGDKTKKIDELTEKCTTLQKECDELNLNAQNFKEELDGFETVKQSLERRISELEIEVEHINKNRLSIDAIADNARRRRQSMHDSRRVVADDLEEHSKMEAVFGSRGKPDDLFMDIDDNSSNRSTPNRLSRGRDSFYSRPDQSDKDEDSSRPSSVMATRRRRQSIHDLHRSVVRHTPSPHESSKLIDELKNMKSDSSGGIPNDSEVSQLRQCLSSCQQELEELKERYRELDDECETCAQYLRERDEQCVRLKKEKTALEKQVEELNDKLKSSLNETEGGCKLTFKHASVNTDEDWANLHSVVVDRMSFDAEVEKNKKLTKTIEDLRYKKQELKNHLAKMQKAMEKNAGYKDSRELEATKSELKACKVELEELKLQYKELNEECDTCAEYLRERDEQCMKLKQAKAVLEAKLQEMQEDSSSMLQSVRKKRQSAHDHNRAPPAHLQDASTDTTDDFSSHQVEQDESSRADENALARELKQVRSAFERMSKEKAVLEQMMATVPPTMFVATGSAIVQNQQLTDVMKENHKLKKINAKLINICKKRGKSHESNRENEEPADRN